jgi:phospholipase C
VCDDSDHVNCPGGYGPSWVSALVNAVGRSKFWKSTAIFIQWDDWGGLYDPVPPPPPYDRDSLGFRVPLLMLSPYVKHGFVSHTQYETASVLKFAEELWGLPQMAPADKRAASPADSFDFSQAPAKWVPVQAPLPPKFFMHQQDAANYFAPDYE